MMPLWMTATAPVQSMCGWALRSVGAPWVAQRVWPMPSGRPAGSGLLVERVSRLASLPARLVTDSLPSAAMAAPAES